MNALNKLLSLLMLCMPVILFSQDFSDENWDSVFLAPDINRNVYALASGGENVVYAGGIIGSVNGVDHNNIAMWDGAAWHTFGAGVNDTVRAIVAVNGEVYAAGSFTRAGGQPASRIARWDGTAWHTLGTGLNGTVYALGFREGLLYAGGRFTAAGDSSASNLAVWNGEVWRGVGAGTDGTVYAIACDDTAVYFGGRFDTAGGLNAANIAGWNGENFFLLGGGLPGHNEWHQGVVNSISPGGAYIYASGSFTGEYAQGFFYYGILVKWDGTEWAGVDGIHSAVDGLERKNYSHGDPGISAIFSDGDTLYVASGNHSYEPHDARITLAGILRYYGDSWEVLGIMNSQANALLKCNDVLYAGGHFNSLKIAYEASFHYWHNRLTKADGILSYLGFRSVRLDSYPSSIIPVTEIWPSPSGLVCIGEFQFEAGKPPVDTVLWNGQHFMLPDAPLPPPPALPEPPSAYPEHLQSLTVSDAVWYKDQYIVSFLLIYYINSWEPLPIYWDGNEWRRFESPEWAVRRMHVYGEGLFTGGAVFCGVTGGEFVTTKGAYYQNNGEWHALGSGISGGWVLDMAEYDGNLYFAGEFTSAGDKTAWHMAKWSLASEINARDDAKSVEAGGTIRIYPLENDESLSGTPLHIQSIDTSGTLGAVNLIPGERYLDYTAPSGFSGTDTFLYTAADGLGNTAQAAVRIDVLPRFIDGGWTGTGEYNSPDAPVFALCVHENNLILGGRFETAGAINTSRIARWDGAVYHSLGGPLNGDVLALDTGFYGLYLAGTFTNPQSIHSNHIARIKDGIWHGLQNGLNGPAYAMQVSPHGTYVGGGFTEAVGRGSSERIARWDGEDWDLIFQPGSGIDSNVSAVTVFGDNVYVGGHFRNAGDQYVKNIAMWDGENWHALGTGVGGAGWKGEIKDIYADSSGVYAGVSGRNSDDTLLSGSPLQIASVYYWDGSGWSILGGNFANGEDEPVIWTLFMHEGKLYAGGAFSSQSVTLQDGSTFEPEIIADGAAVWDGISWSGLGGGLNGTVYDLALWDGRLYAGGDFACENGRNLAYWQFPLSGMPPLAVDDFYEVTEDSSAIFHLLENDSDPQGEGIRIISLITGSLTGTAEIRSDSASVFYIPVSGFTGEDRFEYVISNETGRKDTAVVTVNVVSSVSVSEPVYPVSYMLYQNHPNPFNPETVISYDLPSPGHVKLVIYDTRGRTVRVLEDRILHAGRHQAVWDTRDYRGVLSASGVYFFRIQAGDYQTVRKMVLMR